jgi:hypothetical protein
MLLREQLTEGYPPAAFLRDLMVGFHTGAHLRFLQHFFVRVLV